MTVEYTNRSGQTYYLHKKITNRGNFRYYFSKDNEINLAEKIPESFEIYENPNGQVFLRRKNKSFINEKDIKMVESLISENTDIEHFFVNSQGKTIIVYLPDIDLDEISGMLNVTMVGDSIKLNQFNPGNMTYSPYINIIFDSDKNAYTMEKVDKDDDLKRWTIIDTSDDMKSLILNNINAFENKTYSTLKILFL